MSEPTHRLQLIQALVFCWNGLSDNAAITDEVRLEDLKKELRVAGQLLIKSVEAEVDVCQELRPLLEVDKTLHELFYVTP